jgi:SAM-dependent methyltransferase
MDMALGHITQEKDPRDVFSHYYRTNHWGGAESRSGKGSSKDRGVFLAGRLPMFLQSLGVQSILDVPCGDLNWMSDFPLGDIAYIGADIVPEMIENNRKTHPGIGEFVCLDACHDPLPPADLIFCRDMVIHLPNDLVARFIMNVARSRASWLICTRFLGPIGPTNINGEIGVGEFRAVDLCEPPFSLPAPLAMFPELFHKWKTLGLWRVDEVRRRVDGWELNP